MGDPDPPLICPLTDVNEDHNCLKKQQNNTTGYFFPPYITSILQIDKNVLYRTVYEFNFDKLIMVWLEPLSSKKWKQIP